MKRRITIVLVTFGVLLLAFLAYYLASERFLPKVGRFTPPDTPETGQPSKIPGVEGRISPVRGGVIYQHDKDHRLRAKYSFSKSEKVGDKLYLTEPMVEWFLRGGEISILRAERGIVTTKDVGGQTKIVNGELKGNVRIVMDRSTTAERLPLDERPDEAIKIFIDDVVYFDNDLLMIRSAGRIRVYSREADIFGRGLRISWSEGKRGKPQLRELKITHGNHMVIREGQDRFMNEMTLPGGVGASAAQSAKPPVVSKVEPPVVSKVEPPVVSKVEPARLTTTVLSTNDKTTTEPASTSAPATVPSGPPVPPAPSEVEGKPVVPDTFVAIFRENVLVTSGARHLEGADVLHLVFEFKAKEREDSQRPERATEQDRRKPPTEPSGMTPSKETIAPTLQSKPDTVTPPAATQPTTKSAVEPPVVSPSTSLGTGEVEPMVVTWTGPLVIRPFRSSEKPVPGRFDVSAKGEKLLKLSDGKAVATCRSFEFHSPGKTGDLVGSPDEPVKLLMENGAEIIARCVRFNRRTGIVNLDGAGSMYLPADSQEKRRARPARTEGPSGDFSAGKELNITWTKNVVASFGQRQVETAEGAENEQFLREAKFFGNVNVREGKTRSMKAEKKLIVRFHQPVIAADPINRIASLHADGNVHMTETKADEATGVETIDFIKSRQLDVRMCGPEVKDPYPREVVAVGDVSAMQEKREISADKMLTITFGPERDKKTGKTKIKPRELRASGDVKIVDLSGSERVEIRAETVTSNVSAGTAVLKGTPAKVTQKDNTVEGEQIDFDQNRESAIVTGPGSLRFYSDTDISGNKYDKPRPVKIAWKKKMDYSGKGRTAIILGSVHLETGGDVMDCGRMDVVFAPAEDKTDTPAEKVAGVKRMKGLARFRFRPRKIETVTAGKNVCLESRTVDKEGFLLERLRLRSENLTYEARTGHADVKVKVKAVIVCDSPGTLTVEDYRPPAKKKANAGGNSEDIITGGLSRPFQSAFRWSKSMKMDQTVRTVWLSGNVRMVHCSGRQMVLTEKLNVRPWSKLPKGRKMVLDCDKMDARFEDPESRTDGREGPPVGRLNLFNATGDIVRLRDGPNEVVCQRILYQQPEGSDGKAIIWGSQPGRPRKNAILYQKGNLRGVSSPMFIWHRKSNRFEARDIKAHGGR